MPNGRDWETGEFEKVQAFFGRHEPALSAFAKARNLLLEKYYHDAPAWSFIFRHPSGGVAKVDLSKEPDDAASIHQNWWIDSYAEGVRRFRHEAHALDSTSSISVIAALETAIEGLLQWSADSLEAKGGYRETWHSAWTESEFVALDERFPILRL